MAQKSLFCLFGILLILNPASGQPQTTQPQRKVTVAISEFSPTVIKKNDGSVTGFEIELFEEAARLLNLDYVYKEVDFSEELDLVRKKEVDVAISGITITSERESSGIDFSHRNLDSGLQIMVRKDQTRTTGSFFYAMLEPSVMRIFLILIIFCIVMGLLFLWFERKTNDAVQKDHFTNLVTTTYWSLVTSSTVGYGDVSPKTNLGKIITMFTILGGIAIFGIYISAVSSINVTMRLESMIASPSDLVGKNVATVVDTTSVGTLARIGAKVVTAPTEQDAYNKLISHEVDAVVYDVPPLRYYANNEGADKVILVGPVFERQDYGFAFPERSGLREDFNRALLLLHQNGFYDNLYKKYFGD